MLSFLVVFLFILVPVLTIPWETSSLVNPPSNLQVSETTTPQKDLRLRDTSQPDALCGYIDYTFPWACDAFSTCFYNTDISGVGCCRSSSCNYATGCVPSASITASKGSAQDYVLSCSDNNSPYCGTATFDGDFYRFSCLPAATPNWSWFVFLTSSQSNNAGPVTSITKRLTGTGGTLVAGSSTTDGVPIQTSQDITGTAHSYSSRARSTTPLPSNLASGLSSPTPSNSTPESTSRSTSPKSESHGLSNGAKAGIGVSIFVLFLLGLLCFWRRRISSFPGMTRPSMDTDAHGLYLKPELEAGGLARVEPQTEPRNSPLAEVIELDATLAALPPKQLAT